MTTAPKDQVRILIVEPDEHLAHEMMRVARDMHLTAEHEPGHLMAAAQAEDAGYSCLLVATQGADISGLELCGLIRSREARRPAEPLYLMLYGPDADMADIFSSPLLVDDYLAAPWLDAELQWKLRRAVHCLDQRFKIRQQALEDESGLLTADGLRAFLLEEVNRTGRRHGWISISLLSIPGLGTLQSSYGRAWMEWFKRGLWASLRRQLRNYDRLAVMNDDILCLVSPDLQEEGTRQLLARLAESLDDCRVRGTDASTDLAARYLCVRVLGDYQQLSRSGDILWDWLREKASEPMSAGVLGHTASIALNLEYADHCPKQHQEKA